MRVWNRITTCTVPVEGKKTTVYILGAVNFVFFGVGTLALGIMNDSLEDVFIGVLQLFLPIVGWAWSIVWGILIIHEKSKEEEK